MTLTGVSCIKCTSTYDVFNLRWVYQDVNPLRQERSPYHIRHQDLALFQHKWWQFNPLLSARFQHCNVIIPPTYSFGVVKSTTIQRALQSLSVVEMWRDVASFTLLTFILLHHRRVSWSATSRAVELTVRLVFLQVQGPKSHVFREGSLLILNVNNHWKCSLNMWRGLCFTIFLCVPA